MKQNVIGRFILLLGVFWLVGCDEKDRYKEVAEVAEKAADRQAQQNTEMAQVNREVAEGTRRLVTADAEARKEVIAVHKEIQAERSELNDGFEALETERKQIAGQRRTESIIVPATKTIGAALVATAVVVFCLLLVVGLRNSDTSDAELSDLLIHDLVRDQPRLLNGPAQPAIETRQIGSNSEQPLLNQVDGSTDETPTQGETH